MSDLQSAKRVVRSFYADLDAASVSQTGAVLQRHCISELIWRGFHPCNLLDSAESAAQQFWIPLKTAFPRLQRRLDLFFAGRNEIDGFASVWVASMGHLMGLFDEPLFGIRPTGKIAMLRYAAFHKVEDDRITETAMFFDLPHVMLQAGQNPFPPQTGAHLVQPGPMTHDGLMFDPQDSTEAEKTLAVINAMLTDLRSSWKQGEMPDPSDLRHNWHDDMIWWGPAGIGATFTVDRYVRQHSGPFRRTMSDRRFNGHLCKMAEGNFGGFFGWPNLTLTPTGGFMGMPATGRPGDMRVIDMYRRDGDKLAENWIFIDLLHFWKQQGLDVLARMQD